MVEIVELEDHPWYVASQFHPEFKSKPDRPHLLFREFIHHAFLHGQSALSGEKVSAKAPASSETASNESAGERERAPSEVA